MHALWPIYINNQLNINYTPQAPHWLSVAFDISNVTVYIHPNVGLSFPHSTFPNKFVQKHRFQQIYPIYSFISVVNSCILDHKWKQICWQCYRHWFTKFLASTIMSVLEAAYLMEASQTVCKLSQNSSAPQNRSTLVNVLVQGISNTNFKECLHKYIVQTRQIRTPVLRIPPAVTSQGKMKNWLHECQKLVSHMIGQYAHI